MREHVQKPKGKKSLKKGGMVQSAEQAEVATSIAADLPVEQPKKKRKVAADGPAIVDANEDAIKDSASAIQSGTGVMKFRNKEKILLLTSRGISPR